MNTAWWRGTLIAALLASGAWAQQPAPVEQPPAEAALNIPMGDGDKPDPIKAILEQEVQPAPGQYTYNPQGRRDPFVSLMKPVSAEEAKRVKKPGPEGFLIQEVALKGVVKTPEGFTAMVLGPDGKSYFVKLGQRFYDGAVTALDGSSVTFRQEVADPLSPVRTREVRKSLYTTEEARQ
jgi:type IV pilus assembly protein PilP